MKSPTATRSLGLLLCAALVPCVAAAQTDAAEPMVTPASAEFLRVDAGQAPGLVRGELVTSIGLRLRRIPAGSFLMGSPPEEKERDGDEIQHQVTITRDFWLGATEITQVQWRETMGTSPSVFRRGTMPVENVSWFDAVEFCNALSLREGLEPAYQIQGEDVSWDVSASGYRLPTEAEWEYACRAGTTTPFHFGDNIDPGHVNYDGTFPFRRGRKGRYRTRPVEVGSLPANPWGLHEMHGNVWEWCWDWLGPYATGSVQDPVGPSTGSSRVLRGGSWYSFATRCQSANRGVGAPGTSSMDLGFRLARSVS